MQKEREEKHKQALASDRPKILGEKALEKKKRDAVASGALDFEQLLKDGELLKAYMAQKLLKKGDRYALSIFSLAAA